MKHIFAIEGINGCGKDTVMEVIKEQGHPFGFHYTKPDAEKLKTLSSFTNGSNDGVLDMVKFFIDVFDETNKDILASDNDVHLVNRYYLSNLTYAIKAFYGMETLNKIDFSPMKDYKSAFKLAQEIIDSSINGTHLMRSRREYLLSDGFMERVERIKSEYRVKAIVLKIDVNKASSRIAERTGKANEVATVNHKLDDMRLIDNLYSMFSYITKEKSESPLLSLFNVNGLDYVPIEMIDVNELTKDEVAYKVVEYINKARLQ